jgi:hypothetical protein
MNIVSNWNAIRRHFNRCFRSNFHVSIASVDQHGQPTVTPIGSLFLNDDQSGFYFEKFPSKLPEHATANENICVLAVNSNKWFWIKSLFAEKFEHHPAIKLYGKMGARRTASAGEVKRLKRRMRYTRSLSGHKYLWGEMDMVREISFHSAEKIQLGKMTQHL